ncbi:glucosamine-6-phosphate deaminase [Paenibacillus tarimensis]
MEVKVFGDQHDLDSYAASLIVHTVKDKTNPVLGLATGSTPIGIYRALVEDFRQGTISFRGVTTYNLDEYVGLPPVHSQSYAYYMKQHLFQHIDIDPSNINIPNGMADDLSGECRRYDSLLEGRPIDLQLLGIGHNGHIGFNEPGDTLTGGTHVVELKEATRRANARFFTSYNDVPKLALTMGVGSILKARKIVLCVRGSDKAQIVKEALTGPITTACPASLLQTHANVIVLLDRDAGKEWIDHVNGVEMAH